MNGIILFDRYGVVLNFCFLFYTVSSRICPAAMLLHTKIVVKPLRKTTLHYRVGMQRVCKEGPGTSERVQSGCTGYVRLYTLHLCNVITPVTLPVPPLPPFYIRVYTLHPCNVLTFVTLPFPPLPPFYTPNIHLLIHQNYPLHTNVPPLRLFVLHLRGAV